MGGSLRDKILTDYIDRTAEFVTVHGTAIIALSFIACCENGKLILR